MDAGVSRDAGFPKGRGRRAVVAVAAGLLAFVAIGGPAYAGTYSFLDRATSCTVGIWNSQNYNFDAAGGVLQIKYVDADVRYATKFRWYDADLGTYSTSQTLTHLQQKSWSGLDPTHAYRPSWSKASTTVDCNGGWTWGMGNYYIDFNVIY